MKDSVFQWLGNNYWKILFFITPFFYCIGYAPFGINETDGGVFTSMAWQLENGKTLYKDLVYVRPPLTVWLRWLELQILPEQAAILGERWLFYFKQALYCSLGAAILYTGTRRWMLACIGFVVSAHNFSPMIWHTTDGVLFSVLGFWLFFNSRFTTTCFLSGVCIGLAVLCKQSFYPLLVVFPILVFLSGTRKRALISLFGLGSILLAFYLYLAQNQLVESFWAMTSGSTTFADALQHGIGDYGLAAATLLLVGLVFLILVKVNSSQVYWFFVFTVLGVILVYPIRVYLHQETTVPWHESRYFFLSATLIPLYRIFFLKGETSFLIRLKDSLKPLVLLAISWCTAISWGYNLPILFGVPLVWGVMEWGMVFKAEPVENRNFRWKPVLIFGLLLLVFRYAHQFIYRDGDRSEMTQDMGDVFPQLTGIYSDVETLGRYQELKVLATRYPNFKTVPAFLAASYLTKTRPPLAIDWLIDEEINEANGLVMQSALQTKPVLFLEKAYLPGLYSAKHLRLVQQLIHNSRAIGETKHFLVLQMEYSRM